RIAQECARVETRQIDGKHVRNVEHARIATHRMVLLDLRAVGDRHVPAAEVDHLRTGGAVHGVERSLLEHGFSRATKKGEPSTSVSPRLSFYLRDCGAMLLAPDAPSV